MTKSKRSGPVASGKVLGFGPYEIWDPRTGRTAIDCSFCGSSDSPLMTVASGVICEICSVTVAWIWRRHEGQSTADSPFPYEPSYVSVLVVRDRPGDLATPFDFLMVEHVPSPIKRAAFWELPNALVKPTELPEEAALRALASADFQTWIGALDLLYTGYTARGRMRRVYLARAYYAIDSDPRTGEAPSPDIQFLSWPTVTHVHANDRGFHAGLMEAFNLRRRLHKASDADTPLSLHMSGPGALYLDIKETDSTYLPPGMQRRNAQLLQGYASVMSTEEQQIANFVTKTTIKWRDAAAIARQKQESQQAKNLADKPVKDEPAQGEADEARPETGVGGPAIAGHDSEDDDDAGDSDENAVGAVDFGGGGDGGGFVRPSGGVSRE